MNWMDQPYELFSGMFKSWAEKQQDAFQTLAAATSGAGTVAGTATAGASIPPSDLPLFTMDEMWKAPLERWVALMQQPSPGSLSEETLRKLFDPNQWAKSGQDPFHDAIEHLATGPNFADLWMLDKKFLRAQQLRIEHERDIGAYHAVVRAAWQKTFDRFVLEINDVRGTPLTNWRAITDLWIKIANQSLMETHRTPEFLEAQRTMTRSGSEYRLQQREIIEAYCDANHIPTRTEVDEVQRTVYELRRQVRALEASLSAASTKADGKVLQPYAANDAGDAPAEAKPGRRISPGSSPRSSPGNPPGSSHRSSPSRQEVEAHAAPKPARKRAKAPAARKKPGVSP